MTEKLYLKLEDLENQYPATTDVSIESSYSGNSTSIKYSGIYPDNFLKFDIIPLDDIKLGELKTNPEIAFRFIVRFQDGEDTEDWTSAPFLKDLHDSIQNNQPFFNRDTVSMVVLDLAELSTYWESDKFKEAEEYAHVEIIETIKSKEEIIKHINWIIGSDEKLRPVLSYGLWTPLPIEESEDIDIEIEEIIEEPIEKFDYVGLIENTKIVLTPKTTITFAPFKTAGGYTGEVRKTNNGEYYTWVKPGKWIKT